MSVELYLPWLVVLLVFLIIDVILTRILVQISEIVACIAEWLIAGFSTVGAVLIYNGIVPSSLSWAFPLTLGGALIGISALFNALYLLPFVSAGTYLLFAVPKQLAIALLCGYTAYSLALSQPIEIGLYLVAGYYFLPLVIGALALALVALVLLIALAIYIVVLVPVLLVGVAVRFVSVIIQLISGGMQTGQGMGWFIALFGAFGTARALEWVFQTFASHDYWAIVRLVIFTVGALVIVRKAEESKPSSASLSSRR